VASLVDGSGRTNHLAAAWRRADLAHALAAVGDPVGAAMRALAACVDPADRATVEDTGGWGRDCDTWDDLADARAAWEDR
jgi:hypothetical protein